MEVMPYSIAYLANKRDSYSYIVPMPDPKYKDMCKLGLPIPPNNLYEGYGKNSEEYLTSGEKHISKMRNILKEAGYSFEEGNRILDFGCAGGRMIRWFNDIATKCEIWGTDISSEHIIWCKQYT